MLIDTYLSTCLYAALSGVGLVVLSVLYRDYRIDRMRDELFAVRDELFDYAVQEGLLAHPGYRHLRNVFNGMLRFCHKVSFFRLSASIALDILLVPPKERKNPFAAWVKTIDELPEHQKAKLLDFHLRLFVIVMRYMNDTSFLLAPAVMLFRIKGMLGRVFQKAGASGLPALFRKTERGWQIIEEQALEANR